MKSAASTPALALFTALGALCLAGCSSSDALNSDAADAAASSGTSQVTESGKTDAAAQQSMQSADDAGSSAAATQAVAPAAAQKEAGSGGHGGLAGGHGSDDGGIGGEAGDASGLGHGSDDPKGSRPRPVGLTAQLGCLADVGFSVDGNQVAIRSNLGAPGCKRGKRSLSGNETIVVDPATQSMKVFGTVTTHLPNGSTVTSSPLDANQPLATLSRSGRPADGAVVLSATLNQHRVAHTAQDANLFAVDVSTPGAPVTIRNAYDQNGLSTTPPLPSSRVIDGVVRVHHLLAGFVSTNTLSGIGRDLTDDCACPSSGSISQVVVYDADQSGFTRVTTFDGCGSAKVTTSGSNHAGVVDGTAQVTWAGCS